MADELLIPLISDVVYGILLLSAVVAYLVVGFHWYIAGYAVGVALGYAIHAGSHMLGYSVNTAFSDE